MKRKGQRNRQFSATRLQYSRDRSSSVSAVSPHHNAQRKSQSKSLLCNNCFNRNVIRRKQDQEKKKSSEEKENNWSFMENSDSRKSRQFLDEEMKKVNEYNLNKILENKLKKQSQKKAKDNERNYTEKSYEEQLIKMRKKNEEKRIKLKQDLEKQITFAKERRTKTRKQSSKQEFLLFEPQIPTKKRNYDQQNKYKEDLIKQINQRKTQKQKQTLRQITQNNQNQFLSIIKQNPTKKGYQNMYQQNYENVKEELNKRNQSIIQKRNQMKKERQEMDQLRILEQNKIQQQNRCKQMKRKEKIGKYIHDLQEQIKENQIHREQEFNRVHKQIIPSTLIPPHNIQNNPKAEPCSSCSQPFPRQFLTQYSLLKQ